ncbi:hypothetical protein FI667_g15796, partial [Globisporangium splendens]
MFQDPRQPSYPIVRDGEVDPMSTASIDSLLIALLVVEVGVIAHVLLRNDHEKLAYQLGLIVFIAIAVRVTKVMLTVTGRWLSRTFLQHLGDPLKENVTMVKWRDRGWQLLLHFAMVIFDLVVLEDETWWQDTSTINETVVFERLWYVVALGGVN